MRKRFYTILAALAPAAVFAEGESDPVADAVTQATSAAESLAAQLVPASVTIVFAFAGILGVFAVWKILKRGVRGA